jgi:hypothetical protein
VINGVIRTRRARALIIAAVFSVALILVGFWAGAVTGGFFGALYVGGAAIIFFLLLWGIISAVAFSVSWIMRGAVSEKE